MRQSFRSKVLVMGLSACIMPAAGAGAQGRQPSRTTTLFDIPESLRAEHEELNRELAAATKFPGQTGQAALRVARLMHGHFESEEALALPPLGLLRRLASGELTGEMRQGIAMAERMKAELPRMLEEHRAIVAALGTLEYAALEERHRDVPAFVEKLKRHAQQEEQVLYPAAIVVGELLKLKFLANRELQ